jgi:hypothetical protein
MDIIDACFRKRTIAAGLSMVLLAACDSGSSGSGSDPGKAGKADEFGGPAASICDDGSELGCRSLPPSCDPGTEVALIDSCWACVDPRTCAAPGEPGPCDEESTAMCRALPPECDEGLIVARQNDCWECVDPQTCLPVEAPQQCDDGSELLCRCLPQPCSEGLVSVVIEGCWQCVDPNTCEPIELGC